MARFVLIVVVSWLALFSALAPSVAQSSYSSATTVSMCLTEASENVRRRLHAELTAGGYVVLGCGVLADVAVQQSGAGILYRSGDLTRSYFVDLDSADFAYQILDQLDAFCAMRAFRWVPGPLAPVRPAIDLESAPSGRETVLAQSRVSLGLPRRDWTVATSLSAGVTALSAQWSVLPAIEGQVLFDLGERFGVPWSAGLGFMTALSSEAVDHPERSLSRLPFSAHMVIRALLFRRSWIELSADFCVGVGFEYWAVGSRRAAVSESADDESTGLRPLGDSARDWWTLGFHAAVHVSAEWPVVDDWLLVVTSAQLGGRFAFEIRPLYELPSNEFMPAGYLGVLAYF